MADHRSSESSASPTFSSGENQTPGPSSKKAKIYHDQDWKAVDSQRSFGENWRKEYFVIPHPANSSHFLCLICQSVVAQLKTHTIKPLAQFVEDWLETLDKEEKKSVSLF